MKPTRETYDELVLAYQFFNRHLFDGILPDCLITLQREKNTCGYFSAGRFGSAQGAVTDEIAINPSYFAVTSLTDVMQTLVHEMCHLWQHHYGNPGRGRYHNQEWADKMESIGLMPSSTGRPGGKKTGDCMADYAIHQGGFLTVLNDLLKQSFALSWFDRFPDVKLVQYGEHSHVNTLINMPTSATVAPFKTNNAIMSVVHIKDTVATVTPVKSTRIKYTCECGINIWAKPSIQVRCCECNADFISIQYIPTGEHHGDPISN